MRESRGSRPVDLRLEQSNGASQDKFVRVIQNSVGANLAVDVWSLGCIVLDMATTKTTWSQYKGSPSGKFVHPCGVEHYLSDSINALRNCYGDKQLFTLL
ncbi:hypothetical protein D8674_039345 [Pyrus ussuriensis x Pyrus communis]|uniref:Protein kinase domain-containing protein n=1 Tax=Pyrus ussuriensis x Pyrus communis TaxID=2448454 RepID=A0A5N5H2U2_9ROSA|nr:hypothetical protein D8674_039345 [Pyrus ussuriensis x Pyrus communis]